MMILTCPNCATRFFVERESIGPAGRRVKCSACATEWVAYRADDGEAVVPATMSVQEGAPVATPASTVGPEMSPPTPSLAPEPEPATSVYDTPEADASVQVDSSPTSADESALGVAPPPAPDSFERQVLEPQETSLFTERGATAQAPAKRRQSQLGLLLLLLAVVIAVLAGVFYYRSQHATAPGPVAARAMQGTGSTSG